MLQNYSPLKLHHLPNTKKVLVAPLNWGLGHAARCIPIINELLSMGVAVSIASDGNALQLLKHEFPQLVFFELPSYNITYGTGNDLLFSIPSILKNTKKAIAAEHEALEKLIAQHPFDLLISDNRYGIWHDKIHSVFITHQINIQVPAYLKWLQPALLNYNLKMISNFKECWIPDVAGDENLSGALAHRCELPGNTYYIGSLSRFYTGHLKFLNTNSSVSDLESNFLPAENQLLILLSGPEPQRTIFEKLILSLVADIKYNTLIVQGLTQTHEVKKLSPNVTMVSYLTASDLYRYITSAELIVSRSGYSTIMDLAATNAKALLIPTPGQTEQEYLAKIFAEAGIFYSVKQDDFNLNAIEKATTFKGISSTQNMQQLQSRLKAVLA